MDESREDLSKLDQTAKKERERLRRLCGRNIARLMIAKGWSRADLARECGLARAVISNYLRGVQLPDLPHLQLIASALQVSPADLTKAQPPVQDPVRVELRGDVAVLNLVGLTLGVADALALVDELRRLSVRDEP